MSFAYRRKLRLQNPTPCVTFCVNLKIVKSAVYTLQSRHLLWQAPALGAEIRHIPQNKDKPTFLALSLLGL